MPRTSEPSPTHEGREIRGHFKRWCLPADEGDAVGLARGLGLPELLGRLLVRRGLRDDGSARNFLDPKLTDLHDPALLPGCDRAAQRLVEAVQSKQRIVIYGDYDVDGVTATAILFHLLRTLDPEADVRCYVPHRIEEGYGLNAAAIGQLCDEGAKLILSVDCGITAVEPAAVARQKGVDLIITDHHTMGEALPDAFAIVHPRLAENPKSSYPFPDLCGAGVAYKLAWQTARVWCQSEKLPDPYKKLLVDLLPLAALGTIADVVPLVGENRVLVRYGLSRIKNTPWDGLNALIDTSRLRDEKIDSYHVGYVLGPRLNACGRMGHAREAVRLLTEANAAQAHSLAEFLNLENERRRATERKIFDQAKAMVKQAGYDQPDCRAVVLAHDEWHAGVVGIVCSRLVEAFGRPTVLLSTANGEAQGSARSIGGYDIHEAFTACAEHLTSYGGHAMAAGLRMEKTHVDAFRRAMMDHAAQHIPPDQLTLTIQLDAEVSFRELTLESMQWIQKLQPFGRDNPDPVFRLRDVQLKQPARTMGAEARHLSFLAHQDGVGMRCVAWNMGHLQPQLPAGTRLDLAAQPKLNTYNGRTNVELVVEDFRLSARE